MCGYYSQYVILIILSDVLVSLASPSTNYDGFCEYYVNEDAGPLTVCVEVLFINGTSTTTSNYTVRLSANDYYTDANRGPQSK